jgi:hypothetical protein
MTLETWVRPINNEGYNAIIAKTQGSEFALFSDEGVPQFDIHLNGAYVTAAAQEKLPTDQWTHLAGVFDGNHVSLYVNGKRVAQVAGSGTRGTNTLPLFLGADPDSRGNPTRSFTGWLDEVRLSAAAVYDTEFSPQRRLAPTAETVLLFHLDRGFGPFQLDHSSTAATGIRGDATRLVPLP